MPGSTDTSLLVMHCPCNVQIELLLLFLRSDRLKSAAAALCNGVAFILTIGHAMATYVNEGASKWPPRTNTSISSRDNNRAGGDYSRHRLVDSGASPYTRYSEDRNSQKPLSPYNAFAKVVHVRQGILLTVLGFGIPLDVYVIKDSSKRRVS